MSEFALVRVDNSKFSTTYSDPILKADSLEEMELKLNTKTTGRGPDPLDDFELADFGGLL